MGIREGAQLTAQDTMDLKEKLVSSTKARVAATPSLRNLLGSVRPRTKSEEVTGCVESELDVCTPAASSDSTPLAVPLVSDASSGAPTAPTTPHNPLRALSKGLTAQLGATLSSSPVSSPQGEGSLADHPTCMVDQLADCGSRAGAMVVPMPACHAKDQLSELDIDTDDDGTTTATGTATGTPAVISPAATATTTTSSPEAAEPDGERDAEASTDFVAASSSCSMEETKPATKAVSVARRLKGFSAAAKAAVRFKGLRQGWQSHAGSSVAATAEGATKIDIGGESGSEQAFWTLPSCVANYVELHVSDMETGIPSTAVADQSSDMQRQANPSASSQPQGTGILGARRLSVKVAQAAQRTQEFSSGFFARSMAAVAARSRPASQAADTPTAFVEDAEFSMPADAQAFAPEAAVSPTTETVFTIGSDDDYETSTVSADSPCHARLLSEGGSAVADDKCNMPLSAGDVREHISPEVATPPKEANHEDGEKLVREESF